VKRIVGLILAIGAVSASAWVANRVGDSHGAGQAFDVLGLAFEPTPAALRGAATGAGLLLIGSWLVGKLLQTLKLPKITGFLIFGMVVGPSALAVITKDQLGYLTLVNNLAISVIALTAGGEIRLPFIRKSIRAVLSVLGVQIIAVLALGGVAAWYIVGQLAPDGSLSGTAHVMIALVVGSIATASSPAVVIAVINEMGVKGAFPQSILAVTVCKDMALVVLFAVLLAMASAALQATDAAEVARDAGVAAQAHVEAHGHGHHHDESVTVHLIKALGGSLLAGLLVGGLLSLYAQRIGAQMAIVLTLACFGMALLSEALGLEPLLVALTAGIMLENVWGERAGPVFETLERLSLPVYCIFFAVAGAKVDLGSLGGVWQFALILVAARAFAVWLGTLGGVVVARGGPEDRAWLWTGFVSQAGVAVALAGILTSSLGDHPIGGDLFNVLLAAIAVNELVGPMLLKLGLSRATGGGGAGRADPEPEPR
jgi:Kef-type K+ transport system membrane component KefB